MAQNRIRAPFYIENGDASADLTGNWLNIEGLDNVGFQAKWEAGVLGTFAFDVSEDERLTDSQTNVPSGRLGPTELTLPDSMTGADATPDGSTAGSFYFDFNQISAPWIRMRFVAGDASAGTVNVGVSAKGL